MLEGLKDIFYQRKLDSLRGKQLPDTICHDKNFLEYCLKNEKLEFWSQFEPLMFDENIVNKYGNLLIEKKFYALLADNSAMFHFCIKNHRLDLLNDFNEKFFTEDIVNRYGEKIIKGFGGKIPGSLVRNVAFFNKCLESHDMNLVVQFDASLFSEQVVSRYGNELLEFFSGKIPDMFRGNESFFGLCLRNGKWDLVKQFDERLVTNKIVRGNEVNIIEAYHGIPKIFEKNSELLMFCLNNKRYDCLTQFDEHLFSTEIVNKYGESIINFAIKNGRFDYLKYFEPYNLFSEEVIQNRTDEILKKLSGKLPEKLMTSIPLFEACVKSNRGDLLKQFDYSSFPNEYIERNADVIAKYAETPSPALLRSVSFFEGCFKNSREDLLKQFDYSLFPIQYIEKNADVIAKYIETISSSFLTSIPLFEACVKNNREDLLKQFDLYFYRNLDIVNIASRELNDSNNIKLLLHCIGKLFDGFIDEKNFKQLSDIVSFLVNDEEKFQLLCNNECFSNFFLKTLKRDVFFRLCDDVENFQKKFLNQSKLALRYILESEENTFQYLYTLRNQGVSNRVVDEYNRNFELLQKVKPNISLGNTSLRKEMLQDDFIGILGLNYINTILIYDTEACDIVVDIYQKGELQDLRDWLDYCTSNIARNGYQIHQFILSYNNMKSLVKEVMNVQKQGVQLNEEQLFVIEQITNNENKYGIHSMSDIPNYYKKRFDILSREHSNDSIARGVYIFDIYPGDFLAPHSVSSIIESSDVYEFFVARGLITKEELQYLQPIFDWVFANENLGKSMFKEGYSNVVKSNQVMMMTKKICKRIRDFQNKRLNEHLTSISELKKKASTTDKSSDIYLEHIDGVEVITIKDIPFHIFDNQVRYEKGSTNNNEKGSFTMEHMFYRQFEMFSEVLKDKIRTSGDCISKQKNLEVMLDDPNAWNEFEAIQTISCGNIHPFITGREYPLYDVGFGFGADSNLLLRGVCTVDLGISHDVRARLEYNNKQSLKISSLYNNVEDGETFFDRNCEKGENFDNILKPEFIVSPAGNDEVLASNVERAKILGVNTVLVIPSSYSKTDYEKINLKAQKALLETLDMKLVWDLYYSPIEEVNGIKALNQVLLILKGHLTSKKITQEEYLRKIQELRYECYDVNKKALKELDMLLGKTDERNELMEDNRGVKKR